MPALNRNGNGFVLGLGLGLVFVPCAGPVLASITVLAATAQIGPGLVVLTLAYSVGVAIPLLAMATAGGAILARVKAVRERTPAVRSGRRRDHDRHGAGHRLQRGRAAPAPHAELARRPELERGEQRRGPGAARRAGRRLGGLGCRFGGSSQGSTARDPGRVLTFDQCEADPSVLADCGPAPELTGITGLAQHRPAHPGRPARQGRARRLLDVLVHQLPAHAAVPDRLVREVPRRRARDRRRALPRVRLREGHRERQGQRRPPRGHLPDRAGQRLRHLAGLSPALLAGALPHRRHRRGATGALRRGLVRPDRGTDPPAARPGRHGHLGAVGARADRGPHARDLPRHRADGPAHQHAGRRGRVRVLPAGPRAAGRHGLPRRAVDGAARVRRGRHRCASWR